MKSVAMVFDGLITGGIEKVGSDYAKIFEDLDYNVTIINLNPKFKDMEREFPSECKFRNVKFTRGLAPERYAQLIKSKWYGRFIYPVIFMLLTLINFVYKVYCKLRFSFLRQKFDLAIAFSGHFNDLTFVSNDFVSANKKMGWLHGALYEYVLISDGYLNLYKKIKNLIVLVSDGQKEVLTYHNYVKLNVNKLYNPTFMENQKLNVEEVKNLRSNYGPYLLMVARFSYPHKDHYTVINALEILNKKFNKYPNLVFVGTGPEEEKVKKFVEQKSNNIASKIFFLGNQTDMKKYYAGATMLVHASVTGEGLPTVMIEALANDLPMVVTDSKVGPREILGDNKFGLLSEVENPDDMAEKINELLSNSTKYEEYKNTSKLRLEDFKPHKIEIQLEHIIENLI